MHRDLKTANCFLMLDGKIKIGDLNVSKLMARGLANTQIGYVVECMAAQCHRAVPGNHCGSVLWHSTPYYMSPEIWRNRPYDEKSDMCFLGRRVVCVSLTLPRRWSVGCIVYELAALRVPFRGDSMEELSRCLESARVSPTLDVCRSQACLRGYLFSHPRAILAGLGTRWMFVYVYGGTWGC